jgi:L-lactate dehydrogenase complex protein LldE
MRVALFVTCVNDALYPETGRATVSVLERLGHEVVFPAAQTCCGQMHLNSGYRPEALRLARRFVDIFSSYEAIVCPSASCAGTVAEAYAHAAEDAGETSLAQDARALSPRVHELSKFLVDVLGVTDVGASFPHRVAYHPTCHSLRVLRAYDQPLSLLHAVRGLCLVELPGAAVFAAASAVLSPSRTPMSRLPCWPTSWQQCARAGPRSCARWTIPALPI